MEFYLGSLKRRCTSGAEMVQPETWCGDTGSEELFGSTRCASQFGHVCTFDYANPYNGLASFDSIGQAILILCSITSMSDWSIYFQALEEAEFSVSFMFPVVIIVIMALVAVNLLTAAIAFGFSRVVAEQKLMNKQTETDSQTIALSVVVPDSTAAGLDNTEESETVSPQASGCCFTLQAKRMLLHTTSENIVMVVVVMNSALMASHHASMSELHKDVMWYGEIGFTSFFCAEVMLKLCVFGTEYFKDNWNIYDSVIAFFSLLDLLLECGSLMQMRLLRLFRALRTSRVLRRLKSVRQILAAMSESSHMLVWVLALLLCVQFMFALVTHQLFAGKLNKYDPVPRANFDSILSSSLCLCQCITGNSWESIMFNAMSDPDTGWAAAPCFVASYVIANFLIINLLVASILHGLDARTIETTDDDGLGSDKNAADDEGNRQDCCSQCKYDTEVAESDRSAPSLQGSPAKEDEDGTTGSCCQNERSLWIFEIDSWVRVRMHSISKSRMYDIFLLANVLLSTGVLVLDAKKTRSGQYRYETFESIEKWSTHYFTVVFAIDFLVHAIAHGVCNRFHHSVFIKLDTAAFALMLVDLVTHAIWDHSRLLRVGRCGRPLRLFGRAPLGAKRVVNSFVKSLPMLFQVVLICNVVWFIFAVLATMQFAGMLSWCNDDTRAGKSDCIGTFVDLSSLLVTPRRWQGWWRNFDHVGHAYVTLYECVSTDSWSEVLVSRHVRQV